MQVGDVWHKNHFVSPWMREKYDSFQYWPFNISDLTIHNFCCGLYMGWPLVQKWPPLGSKIVFFFHLGGIWICITLWERKRLFISILAIYNFRFDQYFNFWDGPYMGCPLVPTWPTPGVQNWFLHLGGIWTCITLQEIKRWFIFILAL